MGSPPDLRNADTDAVIIRPAFTTPLLILFAQAVSAQNPCPAPGPDCAVVGKLNVSVGVGAGGRTNPLRGKSDMVLPVIPQISFYGKRFFLENLEVGYSLLENASASLSLIAAPGYDRAFFYKSDLQNIFVASIGATFTATPREPIVEQIGEPGVIVTEFPVSRRRTSYLAGPELTFKYGRIIGQVNALKDVTSRHHGSEVRAAAATPIIDAEGTLVVSAGLTWKSSEVVRYYYGVGRLYEPGSALNPFVKLAYSQPLSERWSFSALAHYEHLDSAIADSPIMSDHGVATVFAGFVFKVL